MTSVYSTAVYRLGEYIRKRQEACPCGDDFARVSGGGYRAISLVKASIHASIVPYAMVDSTIAKYACVGRFRNLASPVTEETFRRDK